MELQPRLEHLALGKQEVGFAATRVLEIIDHQLKSHIPSACFQGGALWGGSSYNAAMTATSTAKVSHRGQTNLPAELRHRWGIASGGEVGIIDLGDAALIVPGGVDVARRELRRVLRDRYDDAIDELEDPDLADQ